MKLKHETRAHRRNRYKHLCRLAKIWGTPRPMWQDICLPQSKPSQRTLDRMAATRAILELEDKS